MHLPSPDPSAAPIRTPEFVALMAVLTSLVALSIDAMLPALGQMGDELRQSHPNQVQLVISAVFLGMVLGQLLYGPLSDSFGRRPGIFVGLVLFGVGSLVCFAATSMPAMLAGRVIQGIGAAGPRTLAMALVRDRFEGRDMARVMSFITAVFIVVPALAPALGKAVMLVAGWRAIFFAFIVLAAMALVWFGLRQPETLPPERRVPPSMARLVEGFLIALRHPVTLGYTVASGIVFGAFLGYINSAAQLFRDRYGVGESFPLYFGGLALALGFATLVNTQVLKRFRMQSVIRGALIGISATSVGVLLLRAALGGALSLGQFMVYAVVTFFCTGLLFGNFNALAMQPMGERAGVASALVGSLSSLVAMALGLGIGQLYNGSALPVIVGFASLGAASAGVVAFVERRRPGLVA